MLRIVWCLLFIDSVKLKDFPVGVLHKFIVAGLFVAVVLSCGCGHFTVAPETERTEEVGLLLRQQFTKSPCDVTYCRHIHLLLPGGKIVGFNKRGGEVGVLEYMFTNIEGEVRDYKKLNERGDRYHYINVAVAKDASVSDRPGEQMVTTWVRFKVTPEQARALEHEWDKMMKNPPSFRLWGKNCASRSAESLVAAGILPWGLPGLDRPENVYKRVRQFYPELTVERGYFGFDKNKQPYMVPLPQECDR